MVTTFGNEIVDAYTGGQPVQAIYSNGELVWERTTPTQGCYVRWTPTNATGTFNVNGETLNLADYNGEYNYSLRLLDENISFSGSDIVSVETNATQVGSCFVQCENLTTVSLPNCVRINAGAFHDCYSLESLSAPVCSYVGNTAFYRCNLSIINLPMCEYVGDGAFAANPLSSISGAYTFMDDDAFNTQVLQENNTLVLTAPLVCEVNGEPFYEKLYTISAIYVPGDLVDAYKSDSYWSALSDRIYADE